ncbi:serine hydrolase domain-containing protein [Arthrobacter sp. NPDC090010]|uniref:serine hydrolase domain-containing protein n=1 Tax=Arthrobacter sp. NPDC090010 TaxID=3363942 RepID=UPI00380D8A65
MTAEILPRSTPHEAGVDPHAINSFLDAVSAAGIELHSLMIAVDGAVVAESWWRPYDPATPHLLYSLSKSFTSVAAGIAESEGLLTMNDRLSDHLAEASGYGEATIADALRMSVGHLLDPVLDPSTEMPVNDAALRRMLVAYGPEQAPGEVFTYDQLATFAVAKIVERVAGMSLLDYLRPRLLEPLGAGDAKWAGGETNPGFTGLYLRTETITAFGQLLLQRGMWHGRQLVPAAWIELATSAQMANDSAHRFPPGQAVDRDSSLGYGYQFWIGDHGYHAGGAYSQLCIVLPGVNAVVAMTASTPFGQALLDAVWDHLLPALADRNDDPAFSGRQAEVDTALAQRLRGHSVPAPLPGAERVAAAQAKANLGMLAGMVVALRGDAAPEDWREAAQNAPEWAAAAALLQEGAPGPSAPLAAASSRDVSHIAFTRAPADPDIPSVRFGALGGVDLPELDVVRLERDALVLEIGGEAYRLGVGNDDWTRGALLEGPPVPFAVRGGWHGDDVFDAELRMIEGPHVGLLRLVPDSAEFTFTWREPTLVGRDLEGYRV